MRAHSLSYLHLSNPLTLTSPLAILHLQRYPRTLWKTSYICQNLFGPHFLHPLHIYLLFLRLGTKALMIISRSPKTDLASICGLNFFVNTIILPSVDIWIFLGSFTRRQRSHKRNLDIVQWTVSVSRLQMMIWYF